MKRRSAELRDFLDSIEFSKIEELFDDLEI